jgi:class 3 adenylate cyclase/tetratricopeptide (TPR) repeat protein
MDFYAVLDQVIALLKQRGRASYRALKVQFQLDDASLEALKEEIIDVHQLAIDQDTKMLIWTGERDSAPTPIPIPSTPQPASPLPTEHQRDPLSYTPQHLAEKILTSRSALEGERKQVTVLFADLKDSTALIRDLDPEAAQQLLDPALHLMMEAVHRFEGTVNQVLGDGIMALFGAPIAHEDHALRACYSALAMQAAMRLYADEMLRAHGIPMRMRVGLNSGVVVVRTIGNDLHMDYSAVGHTTHLAARMEQLATPDSITLTGATLRLVDGRVRVTARGPIPVKGMPEPVEVYELTGSSPITRRLQAAVARGLTRFVGRDTEIEALQQALAQAKAGHGQMVAVVGEAGVGKSRLVYEFVHSHRTQGWLVLESAAVSYGQATPYFPVIDLLKRYAHVEDGDDRRTIRAKVTGQLVTLDATLQDTIPALLSLVDALPDDSPFGQLDPSQRRQRTLDGLTRLLRRESQAQPLLVVFEDVHWMDSETQALLDTVVKSLPTAPLLLLVNYRPEYQHGWGSKTYYTQVRLDPLPLESAGELLTALLGNDPSLAPLKQLLIERTEGNPFFLEESVRTLVETQVLVGAPGAYRLAQDRPTIQVPATVQAVLAARIDRLPEDTKRLVQTAAVIGTEVSLPLLHAIVDMSEDDVQRGLAQLQAAEFLYETSLYPERVYTFKHALTHEVAYGSVLQERRRVLHAQIVEALERLATAGQTDQVDRLAHHAVRGELWDKALRYMRQAGARAMVRSAHHEAVTCFEQALAALQHLPAQRDTHEQAIDIRLDLRSARIVRGEMARIQHDLRVAETLAEALEDTARLGRVSISMSVQGYLTGQYAQGLVAGQRALALAAASGDIGVQTMAHCYLGVLYHAQGKYRQAVDAARRAVACLEGDLLYERFGQAFFPASFTRAWLSHSLAEMGAFAEAMTRADEALRIAEAVNHPVSLTLALFWGSTPYLRQGDVLTARFMLERAVAMCRDLDLPLYFCAIAMKLGEAYTLCGRVDDAVSLLHEAIERIEAIGSEPSQARALASLSQAVLLAGRLAEAVPLAERALEHARIHQERGEEAYVLRLLGDIARQSDPPQVKQAATHYQQALTLAEALGMRPLQAHCHRSLGTVYSQTGQLEHARTELSTAIDMYRDMAMTFWLPETEAALAEVDV